MPSSKRFEHYYRKRVSKKRRIELDKQAAFIEGCIRDLDNFVETKALISRDKKEINDSIEATFHDIYLNQPYNLSLKYNLPLNDVLDVIDSLNGTQRKQRMLLLGPVKEARRL